MALLLRRACVLKKFEFLYFCCPLSSKAYLEELDANDGEFKKLTLQSDSSTDRRRPKNVLHRTRLLPPRHKRMAIDQDWKSVWPAAASFRPSAVPLPLRQGYNKKGAPPNKTANAELLKIPNFLHLTPPAIKAHCAAIRKFCTAWPEALEETEGFPLEIITNDYCHSGPSIRDFKARIVTLRVKLSDLELEPRAQNKIIRLVGDRYDQETDTLTLVADRCPTRKQNEDYLHYLLTALYHESWKIEPWEEEEGEMDWLCFKWDGSHAEKRLLKYLKASNPEANENELLEEEHVKNVGESLTQVINEEENNQTLHKYKNSILKLFKIPPFPDKSVE